MKSEVMISAESCQSRRCKAHTGDFISEYKAIHLFSELKLNTNLGTAAQKHEINIGIQVYVLRVLLHFSKHSVQSCCKRQSA